MAHFTLANAAENAGGFRRGNSKSAGKPDGDLQRSDTDFSAAGKWFPLAAVKLAAGQSQRKEKLRLGPPKYSDFN